MLAALRPDSVNLPLFLHVLGAMLLVGALAFAAGAILAGWRREGGSASLTRVGLRTFPYGVLPAYVLMRAGAEWTRAAQEYPEGFRPAWLRIGSVTADAGGLLLLVSLVLAWLGLRKLGAGGGLGLGRAAGVVALVLVAAYVVAVWAMTAKPL